MDPASSLTPFWPDQNVDGRSRKMKCQPPFTSQSLNDATKILTETDTETFFLLANFAKPKPRLFFWDHNFRNRNRHFFSETKFSETKTETFFPRPNSPKPIPIPSKIGKCLETETKTETSQYPWQFLERSSPNIFLLLFHSARPYSKILREHKYKDKDNYKDSEKDKDKDTHKVPEIPSICYILKSLWLTHSKYDDKYLTLVILFMLVTLVTLFWS